MGSAYLYEVMDKSSEIEEKTERLVRLLAAENLGGVLIGAQHNFAWLTGGGTNGIDSSREGGAGALFVRRDGRRFVLASKIEMPRLLAEELNDLDYEPVEFSWEEEKASGSFVAERASGLLDNDAPLGSDLPVDKTRVIESALARARYQLTGAETKRYRDLGRDAGDVLSQMVRNLEPGASEHEVARRAADALAGRGMRAVVVLVAADERLRRFRHPVPTDKRWQQTVMVAVCARRGGLIVSLTRIVCAGSGPDELRHRTRAAAHVNASLFHATRPGTTGREMYEQAARAYTEQGFPGEEHLHHQGGAIGYRTREWTAHPQCMETVQSGQAFAWNPSVTGTKVEETCIAFDDEIQVVTESPDWPQVPIEIEGRVYHLPDVLAL